MAGRMQTGPAGGPCVHGSMAHRHIRSPPSHRRWPAPPCVRRAGGAAYLCCSCCCCQPRGWGRGLRQWPPQEAHWSARLGRSRPWPVGRSNVRGRRTRSGLLVGRRAQHPFVPPRRGQRRPRSKTGVKRAGIVQQCQRHQPLAQGQVADRQLAAAPRAATPVRGWQLLQLSAAGRRHAWRGLRKRTGAPRPGCSQEVRRTAAKRQAAPGAAAPAPQTPTAPAGDWHVHKRLGRPPL